MENGHFLILEVDGKKKLARITDVKGKKAVIADKTSSSSSTIQYISYEDENILAYLGEKPPAGSVYGVKVEPFYKKVELKPYGDILFFRKTNKDERKYLLEDLSFCAKKIKAKGFNFIFPIEVEVRSPRGKTAGKAMYFTDKDDGTIHQIMQLFPHEFSDPKRDVIFHEFGHFIWDSRVNDSYKSMWYELYSSAYDTFKGDGKILNTVRDDFKESGPRITEEYTEEYDEVASKVLDFIAEYHGLSYDNLCTLYDNGFDIIQYFPTRVQLLKHETLVTEYADKSVEELFAESFKIYMSNELLPKRVSVLLKKTLKSVT